MGLLDLKSVLHLQAFVGTPAPAIANEAMSSALLNLVEAATALAQLPVAPRLSSVASQSSSVSSASTSPVPTASVATAAKDCHASRRVSMSTTGSTHAISDDDDATLASLRENHLQALRAAAAQAMVSHQSQVPAKIQTAEAAPASASKEAFPLKLHALLADPAVRDAAAWLPHGRAFVVLRPDAFASQVLPRYFAPEGSNSLNSKAAQTKHASQGVHKYPSFTRKLNRWGFRQVSRGPDAGAFTHELFQRDQPQLCRGMVCAKGRRSKAKNANGLPDDLMSVSSASTMGTKGASVSSAEKRPHSATVTVSTAGKASQRSLPFKKRKTGAHVGGIPAMISHRPQKMAPMSSVPTSTSSLPEGDLTSDNGSVASKAPSVDEAAAQVATQVVAEVAAQEAARAALARHFHEQHRAFALASLLENSRRAMEAAGMAQQPQVHAPAVQSQVQQIVVQQSPVIGAATTASPSVVALTVPPQAPASQVTNAEAAKEQLYRAYLQAVSNSR
ncbi:hypothetical protein ACHAXT_004738 [Thalassiosira profunda]